MAGGRPLAAVMADNYIRHVEPDGSAVIWTGLADGNADLMVEKVGSASLNWRATLTAPGRGWSCLCDDPVVALTDVVTCYVESLRC